MEFNRIEINELEAAIIKSKFKIKIL